MIDIHSAEFAQAWRTVSEALLAAIQGTTTTQETIVPPPAETTPISPVVVTPEPVTRHVSSVRYASRVKAQDGRYYMMNLKDTPQDNTIIVINIYDDNTCSFELAQLTTEWRQSLKDNRATHLPATVATIIGAITADAAITTTVKGQGTFNSGRVTITAPMTVEFKN